MEKDRKSMQLNERISLLWVVVMVNMIFADILSFMLPVFFQSVTIEVTEGIMLVFAVILEIPIVMIYLSRVLKDKTNRLVNLIASVITIVFIIGGGSLTLHYIFFAAVEVVTLILIINYALKLTKE
ncbi:MAG: DUF6326 family protein [Spirochaetaceae bacterium JB067]